MRVVQDKNKSARRNPLSSHPTDLYSNIATEPKCKLMLTKSPESAHKNGTDRSRIFRVNGKN